MTVGERIRAARKEAGLTQKQLGEKLGVSAAMIGQYETGARNPKIGTLIKIADALVINVNELVDFNDMNKHVIAEIFENWEVLMELDVLTALNQAILNLSDNNTLEDAQNLAKEEAFHIRSARRFASSPKYTRRAIDNNSDNYTNEFENFKMYIEEIGYHLISDNNQYYLVKDDERKKITVDELKSLVRTSKTVISGLLDDFMHRE